MAFINLIKRYYLFLIFFVLFFALWEASIYLFEIPRYILPAPSEIVIKGYDDIFLLLDYLYVTFLETITGYIVAVVVAVPLGLFIANSSFLRQTIYPFFVSIEMTPKIAFAPVFISWFGFSMFPKVVMVVLVCFFPIVLNAIMAFSSLSFELESFCKATGASRWKRFFKIDLPAGLPQCFVGFKYAAINATVGATIAEFIGSDQGLGYYIQIQTGNLRTDLAFAGIFFLTVLGLAMFGAVMFLEKLIIPWHISMKKSQD